MSKPGSVLLLYDDNLMRIHATEHVDDKLSKTVRRLFAEGTHGPHLLCAPGRVEPDGTFTKGKRELKTHTCSCGLLSNGYDYQFPGFIGHSLVPHFVEFHRDCISKKELEKVEQFAKEVKVRDRSPPPQRGTTQRGAVDMDGRRHVDAITTEFRFPCGHTQTKVVPIKALRVGDFDIDKGMWHPIFYFDNTAIKCTACPSVAAEDSAGNDAAKN